MFCKEQCQENEKTVHKLGEHIAKDTSDKIVTQNIQKALKT